MHDNRSIVEDRITRAIGEQITPALYRATAPLAVSVWPVPGEPVPVSEALAAHYRPAALGDAWAPRFPDPATDQGEHSFSYSLVVGVDVGGAIESGYDLNLPARTVLGAAPVTALLSLDEPAVVVESVKLAEDRSGDVVVRLYESRGGRATARASVSAALEQVIETDLLERPVAADALVSSSAGGFSVRLRPFQIVTLRLRLRRFLS